MRVIDADGLRRRIVAFCTGCSTTYLTVENIVMMINQADTVDVIPKILEGRDKLVAHPEEYLQYEDPDGWGDSQRDNQFL